MFIEELEDAIASAYDAADEIHRLGVHFPIGWINNNVTKDDLIRTMKADTNRTRILEAEQMILRAANLLRIVEADMGANALH